MSKYIKKIQTTEYLTWVNSEGKVCPRLPVDWKDEAKYGKSYFSLFVNAMCVKLHTYEEYYKNPLLMISDITRLQTENETLRQENAKLSEDLKQSREKHY